MKERIEISLAKKATGSIYTPGNLREVLKQQIDKITVLILGYHYIQKERVFDVEIGEVEFTGDNLNGFFVSRYNTNIFNGCSDLDLTDKKEMNITFSIDIEASTILLTGEEMPERYPDEL